MSSFDIDFDAVETFTRFFTDDGSPLDWRILGANCSPRKLRGTLLQQRHALQTASVNGAEVFFMVNETNGSGQTKQNVTSVRALFADLDGTPLKKLDISQALSYGWQPEISLKSGIRSTYKWALKNIF